MVAPPRTSQSHLAGALMCAASAAAFGMMAIFAKLAYDAGVGVSGLFFTSLTRIDAGLTALVLYVYPTLVTLVSDSVLDGSIQPLLLAAFVCAGAASSFAVAAGVSGKVNLSFDAIGRLWIGLIGAVSTVAAIGPFFAGLTRVGASRASIISTIEPLVTVGLAALVFGEALSVVQLAGGAIVLGSVVLVQTFGRHAPATTPT